MEFIKRDPKIFVISGKARSGKGEVSKIISDYYKDKKSIIISFGHYIKDYAKRVSDWNGDEDTKPRELLQQLGIELIKNKINDKLFIRRIREDIEVFSYFYDIIIVNDARLLDEIEALKNSYYDTTFIRVKSKEENNLTTSQKNHITETSLDNYKYFDYVIENNGSKEDLKKQVESILRGKHE